MSRAGHLELLAIREITALAARHSRLFDQFLFLEILCIASAEHSR